MVEPSELAGPARSELQAFAEATEAPLSPARRDALWRQALSRSQRAPSSRWQPVLAFAAACLLGGVLVAGLHRVTAGPAAAPSEVVAAAGARWHREGTTVVVDQGRVRVSARGTRLTVRTPQVSVAVLDARVLVEVSEAGSVLSAEQGTLTWREGGAERSLTAGQSATVAAEPGLSLPTAPAVPQCAAAGAECLQALAAGEGLSAETALFELGLRAHERGELSAATRAFADYGARFPEGVLAPEASVALMLDLRARGLTEQARAEATAFLERFPSETRAAEVRRWREQIR